MFHIFIFSFLCFTFVYFHSYVSHFYIFIPMFDISIFSFLYFTFLYFHSYVSHFRLHYLATNSSVTGQQFQYVSTWAAPFLNPPCLCLCRPSRDTLICLSIFHSLAQIETSERREVLAYFDKLATHWTEVRRSVSITFITSQFTFILRLLPKFHKFSGLSGDRIPVGAKIFANFQTGSGVDPVDPVSGSRVVPCGWTDRQTWQT